MLAILANSLPLGWNTSRYSVRILRLVTEAFLLSDARGRETTAEMWLENNGIGVVVADKMKWLYET